MYAAAVLAVFTSLLAPALATSACTGQQYNDISGFPSWQSACYPTNYYRTSDLGQTSPDDAITRCQQQCTADNSCASVVAQVNKAADNPNFYPSGTCFFYAAGQMVAPRRCADTAFLLLGYRKDVTLQCFSSSRASASQYCSSLLGVSKATSTVTATPSAVTATTTISSSITSTVTTTAFSTPTSTVSATTTITVTVATSTATTTTVTFSATTLLTTTTQTVVSTVTTSAVIVSKKKRATVAPPACVSSDTPTSRRSAACSCLSLSTSTTTTTTLAAQTSSVTTTSSVIISITRTVTSVTSPITITVSGTATSSVTATTTTTARVVIPVTTFSTVTATTTTTTYVSQTTTCAQANGQYTAANGVKFNTICGSAYFTNDPYVLSQTSKANFGACGEACSVINNCNYFDFNGMTSTCYLYSQAQGPLAFPGFSGAIRVNS